MSLHLKYEYCVGACTLYSFVCGTVMRTVFKRYSSKKLCVYLLCPLSSYVHNVSCYARTKTVTTCTRRPLINCDKLQPKQLSFSSYLLQAVSM